MKEAEAKDPSPDLPVEAIVDKGPSFIAQDQPKSDKLEKEISRLEPADRLKGILSVENDDSMEAGKARGELEVMMSGDKPLSKEERNRLEKFVEGQLGADINYYRNAASEFILEHQKRRMEAVGKERKNFIGGIRGELSTTVQDPALSTVEKMGRPAKYHREFVAKNDPDIVDLDLATSSTPMVGINGLLAYRGNGVDFKYVLQSQVSDYSDESKVNDLQPRWVTPDLGTAVGYTGGDAENSQLRVYDLSGDILQYDSKPHYQEVTPGGPVEAHKRYSDQEASKLRMVKMTEKSLAETLMDRYVVKHNGDTSGIVDSEYVLRNKDLRDNLASIYEKIPDGEHKGKWRRVYNREGLPKDHLLLNEYLADDDLNKVTLDHLANIVARGSFDSVENNQQAVNQVLKMIEASGIDIKKYRREYELKFGKGIEDGKNKLLEKAVGDYVLRLAASDILARQKGAGERSEEQAGDLKKEAAYKNIKRVFDPFGLVSRYQNGLHQKNRQAVAGRLAEKREVGKVPVKEKSGLYQSILINLENKFATA